MLTNILKRIWNDRSSNGWLFAELFIVFIILWYVIDFLFASLWCSYQPKGYDTNHVYHVTVAENPTVASEYFGKDSRMDAMMQVYRLVSEYPGIESASIYYGTVPYDDIRFQGYTVDSLHSYRAFFRIVDKKFFEVFKVDLIDAELDDWDITAYPRPAVLSVDFADSLFHGRQKLGSPFFDYYSPDKKYTIGGIMALTKTSEFERYTPFIYVPLETENLKYSTAPIAVRVKLGVEDGFAARFTEDMRDRLNIGPFFFSEIRSYEESREIHDTNMNNYIRTSVAVLLFFIFNVFLSIIGTFWFRTRKRRGEIGLRIATGATPARISHELLLESICILFIAFIPALIVCFNIRLLDLTVNTLMDPTTIRFITGILITLFLMLLTVVIGVWYPARSAMKVQPAEALHEE